MCSTSYRWIQVDSSGIQWNPLEYLHKFGREKTNIQVDSSGFQVQFPFMEYSSWIPCHSFWTFFEWILVDSRGFKWIQVDSSGLLKKFSNLYIILYQIFSAKSGIELFCIFNQINTHELQLFSMLCGIGFPKNRLFGLHMTYGVMTQLATQFAFGSSVALYGTQ